MRAFTTRNGLSVALAATFALTIGTASADDALPPLEGALQITVDRAAVFAIPPGTFVIAIGNAAIADVVKPAPGMAVITGKSFGQTNVVLMDSAGKRVASADIRVVQPNSPLVTVRRGADKRDTYSCTPVCAPSIALGDSSEGFTTNMSQVQQRQTLSATSATPSRPQ